MALLPGMDMYWESQFRGDDVEEWIEYEFMAPVKVTSIWLTTDVAHHPSNPYNSIQVKKFPFDDWETLTLSTLRWYTAKKDGTISLRLDTGDPPSNVIALRWRMPNHSRLIRIYTMQVYGRPQQGPPFISFGFD